MKVQILSRKLIAPSSPTPPNLKNLKISCFDQLAPPTYVPCVFYYPANGEDHGGNNVERSKKIEKSLAETLALFYPLGGRYTEENLSIECSDEGAEYLEARVSGSLSQLLEREEFKTEMWSRLVPRVLQPENSPLVTIQINMFECGGLAIGTCVAHRIADAYTVGTFINTWATACRIGIEKVHCRPSFPFGSLFPPKNIPAITSVDDLISVRAVKKVVRKSFVFKGETISRLKEIATAFDSNQLLKYQPTRVEVVTGLIWMVLIRVARAIHGHLRPSVFGLTVNMRGKTTLTMPGYACGNFINLVIAQFVPDDESKIELHDCVNRVHDAIRSAVEDCAKAPSGDELFSLMIKKMREGDEAWRKSEIDAYIVNSWCRLPWYETDFGWGKPSWVHGVDAATSPGTVTLMDTEDGGGIEAFLGLDESSTLLFQQNLDVALTGN